MKTFQAVKSLIKGRIFFISAGSVIITLLSLLAFYFIFIIMPGLVIKTGIIAPVPLFLLCLLSFAVPFAVLTFRFPFFGEKFRRSIITAPLTQSDVKAAVELDRMKGFPADSIGKSGTLSSFLSEKFSQKVAGSLIIKKQKILQFLFPGKWPIFAVSIIMIITAVLSIIRIDFLGDIITALRTGLPAELISTGPVIKFDAIEARVIPPAYLESKEPRTINLQKHNIMKILEGSKVILSGRLRGITQGELFFSTEKGLEYLPVDVAEEKFEVSFLASTRGAFALEFDIKAGEEISTEKSSVYRVETFPDNPPEIKIFAPEKNHKIVYGTSFGITFTAVDDYGLLEISLCHREAGTDTEFNRELITRFPRESKKEYNTTYIWNPILRDGEKYQELVYHPGTEKVEYFIEVRDINIFSNRGTGKSELMYVSFTSLLSEFKNATDLIQKLIVDGKDLLNDINNNSKIQDYRETLKSAIDTFSNELRDIMPRSSLINESRRVQNTLTNKKGEQIKKPLENYIAFLEKYQNLLNFLMKNQKFEMASRSVNKASEEFNSGNYDSAFKTLASIAEMLGEEILNELDEIQKLMEKGDIAGAQERMEKLLSKIREKLAGELEKSKGMAMQMAREAIEKLDEIIANAVERIKEEKANIIITKKNQISKGTAAQKEINSRLEGLSGLTEELSSSHPLVFSSIDSYARAAKSSGDQSLVNLEKSRVPPAVQAEENVVRYLEALIKDSQQQKEQIQQMAKGNFESLMPQDRMNWFVFIPKEAVYTVPVKYKDKIIEMSKERGKSTKEKESFWRDVLE